MSRIRFLGTLSCQSCYNWPHTGHRSTCSRIGRCISGLPSCCIARRRLWQLATPGDYILNIFLRLIEESGGFFETIFVRFDNRIVRRGIGMVPKVDVNPSIFVRLRNRTKSYLSVVPWTTVSVILSQEPICHLHGRQRERGGRAWNAERAEEARSRV